MECGVGLPRLMMYRKYELGLRVSEQWDYKPLDVFLHGSFDQVGYFVN